MRLSDVLRHKGDEVVTVSPSIPILDLVRILAEHNIGAAVVSSDRVTIEGIVSERDIVRRLLEGTGILDQPVSAIMTTDVHTCSPSATVTELMQLMTERRVRHVPVVVDGRLAGLVSIGDVVKTRIGELEFEREQLANYIAHAG
jgi:CBS domain-containing protein